MDEDRLPEFQSRHVSGASIIRVNNQIEMSPEGIPYNLKKPNLTDTFKKNEQFQAIRGQIINDSLFVEEKIDEIISKILFNEDSNQTDLFINIILSREFFNFMNKKKVMKDLLSSVEPFKKRDYHELYQNIQKVIDERDKFAHGQVSYSGNKGEKIFIQYFKGKIIKEEITTESRDGFLEIIKKCHEYLDKILLEIDMYNIHSQNPTNE